MDVVGRFFLTDGTELSALTGIDDFFDALGSPFRIPVKYRVFDAQRRVAARLPPRQ